MASGNRRFPGSCSSARWFMEYMVVNRDSVSDKVEGKTGSQACVWPPMHSVPELIHMATHTLKNKGIAPALGLTVSIQSGIRHLESLSSRAVLWCTGKAVPDNACPKLWSLQVSEPVSLCGKWQWLCLAYVSRRLLDWFCLLLCHHCLEHCLPCKFVERTSEVIQWPLERAPSIDATCQTQGGERACQQCGMCAVPVKHTFAILPLLVCFT